MNKLGIIERSIPTPVSIGLAVVATALEVLNQSTFHFGQPWSTLVTAGVAALAVLGIGPLTSGQLRNLLHLTYPTALAIAAALTTLATGVTTISGLSITWRSVIVGVVGAIAALVGGPAAGPTPTPPPAAPKA